MSRKQKELEMSLLAKEINKKHEVYENFLKEGFKFGFEVGEMLAEVENLVGSEKFPEWLNENCSFSLGTAQQYMDLFKGEEVKIAVSAKRGEKEQEA